jgi:hypothetical protein
MKFLPLIILLVLVSCNDSQPLKAKEDFFQRKFQSINQISPKELSNAFIEKCDNAEEGSSLSKYTTKDIHD